MKKTLILLILLLNVSYTYSQQEKVLILTQPTSYNIAYIEYFIENDMLNVPNIKLIGFYHEDQKYDFNESKKYIAENKLTNIELIQAEGKLDIGSIYKENNCTQQYKDILAKADGVLFFGGPDLPPATYNEPTGLLTVISDPYRHYFELSFLYHLLGGFQNEDYEPLLETKRDFMIIGFCLGMQTMNVATGGTLVQDIPSEIYKVSNYEQLVNFDKTKLHRLYNSSIEPFDEFTNRSFHPINLIPGGLYEKMGVNTDEKPKVNSYHHQCIQRLGKNMSVEAYDMDYKIIESVSHLKYKNVFGFQFHPEKMEMYYEDEKYRFSVNDTSTISYYQLLKYSESLDFHYKLWNYISEILNN